MHINPNTDFYSYRLGEWDGITKPYNTWLELKKLGISDAIVKSYTATEVAEMLEVGKSFVLNNVNFDSDSYVLREETVKDLDEIITILKNVPAFGLEVAGHTDNSGTEKHNLELSKNRTLAIKKYLTDKGINDVRIITKHFGENNPIAANETDEGKQKNRRVEFKYLITKDEK